MILPTLPASPTGVLTVTKALDRLAQIQNTIPGITTAYRRLPRAIQMVELPAIINILPSDASALAIQRHDARNWLYTLRVDMVLLIRPNIDGQEYAIQNELLPFIESVPAAFARRPRLEFNDAGLVGDFNTVTLAITPNIVQPYASATYVGAVFALTIQYTAYED